jgi:hypothetical protein
MMINKNHQKGKRVNLYRGYMVVVFLVLVIWSAALIICTLRQSLRLPEHDGGLEVSTVEVSAQPPAEAAEPGTLLRSTIEAKESIVEELYRLVSPERLAKLAHGYRDHYKNASPFPHIAIDNIFPNSILQKVIEEHPESDLGANGCLVGRHCFHGATQNLKSAVDREDFMGLYTRILFSFLKSSAFIAFLEGITGIRNIIPDPHFRGSGLHFTAPGGNLNIHADFNRYENYKLDRRVNLFIYLNNDWPDEYGGHLDLWSRDMKTCYERIAPKLGRLVVFSSTDFSCKW